MSSVHSRPGPRLPGSSAMFTGVATPRLLQHRVDVEGRVPAAQEQDRGHRREDEHVHVLGEEEEAEAHAAVLGGEAGHDLGVGLGQVERGPAASAVAAMKKMSAPSGCRKMNQSMKLPAWARSIGLRFKVPVMSTMPMTLRMSGSS